MQAILTAGTVHIHTAFVPAAVIDAIEADRIEFFTAGPSLIDMLVAEIRQRGHADLSSLREIAYGTAPITPSSLTAAVAAFGCRFRQIYGNTESQSMISLLAPEDHSPGHPRLASAGRVSFGWEVRIVDPHGRDLPFEVAGELLIRGECLFSGYWRNPEATAAAFAEGGWYRTGDIAKLTADGYLYILDRAKDMIISGGENIYPAEVEAVLARHPAVADVAVLGRPIRHGARRCTPLSSRWPGLRSGRLGRGGHRLVPRPACALRVPEERGVRQRAAPDDDRQGAQAGTAGATPGAFPDPAGAILNGKDNGNGKLVSLRSAMPRAVRRVGRNRSRSAAGEARVASLCEAAQAFSRVLAR